MIQVLQDFSKRELLQMFYFSYNQIDCFTVEGQKLVLTKLEEIQDAYTGKCGYGAIENEMMKQRIAGLKFTLGS